ncbi:MAG: GNAT family N-acetyltransferase [Pelagimonas sp.]|jgi:hypothetical protein|nr:GNAT family N-acetyltransferase [Pelagimonas sp.]
MLDVISQSLCLPLQQSPEYARACEAMGLNLRACKREQGGDLRLWWQVQSRRFKPLGRVDMVSRGPVGRTPDDLRDWLDRWQHWHDGRPLVLNAEGMRATWLRKAGFWPLMTPATIALLDLGPPEVMRAAQHQKWRNRLTKAQSSAVKVTRHALTPQHWLLHQELEQARDKGYRPLPPALCAAYTRANPGQAVVFEARHRGDIIAGAVMLRHGPMATWQIGHSFPEGRKMNAMNLILWQAMCWLAERGHVCLDLGLLNDQDAPGMTRFKLGTGAKAHRLAGTWLHSGVLAPMARLLPMRLAG